VDNSAGGGVSVNIGVLDAAAKDTTVTLKDTTAWNGTNGVLFNTLNLKAPIKVNGIQNFQYLNFYLPTTMGAGGAMLTISDGGTAHIDKSTVNVGINGASSPLQVGDTVKLIDAGAGALTGTPTNTTANGKGMQGVTLLYEFGIEVDQANKLLLASVTSAPSVNDQSKALSEGFLSGVGLVNQGADLIAGKGMAHALSAAGTPGRKGLTGENSGDSTGFGLGVFAALSGGWTRYNTGSHVDMRGLSFMAGLSAGTDLPAGRLTVGAFFEYSNGAYDSYKSFSNGNVHGKGNLYSIGGGILGRMDFIETGPGNFYTEASFRAGGLHNDYTSDLRDATGRAADYKSSSPYYGIHAGLGYIWNFSERGSLDLYGKYFWTRQQDSRPIESIYCLISA
jgi:hypothetical protein